MLELPEDRWVHHPNGDDVAVAPIALDLSQRWSSVSTNMFLTTESFDRLGFGLGNECFFVGRFAFSDGGYENIPTIRFGHLAHGKPQPVSHERGIKQQSFLVEAHSLSGYSGSPVFIFQTSAIKRDGDDVRMHRWDHSPVSLLGLDWGHLPFPKPVLDAGKRPIADRWVHMNSGMMNVLPSWTIKEIVLGEEVARQRALIT